MRDKERQRERERVRSDEGGGDSFEISKEDLCGRGWRVRRVGLGAVDEAFER